MWKDQSYTTITLDTGIDISTASSAKIIYRKPDGTTGAWTGSVVETTKVRYVTEDGDIDQGGLWKFQAYAVIDGDEAYGELYEEWVKVPISIQ